MERLKDDELRRLRAAAQLLGPARRAPEKVVEHMLVVQAQDLRQARLALRARSSGLTSAAVDRALTDKRSLVVAWLNRGTLHLVRSEDYPWMLQLTAQGQLTGTFRRLSQEGVGGSIVERAIELMKRGLADGPLTRDELRERVAAIGIRTEGQALIHLLGLLVLRGIAVRGPLKGRHHAYVLVGDWLGESAPVDRDKALGELARRYLKSHGPATDADFAYWSGLPLRDVRAGLKQVARSLRQEGGRLFDLKSRKPPEGPTPPRLLPMWDDYLLGWRDRSFLARKTADLDTVYSGGGMIGPVAVDDGRAVGTWKAPRKGTTGKLELKPFGRWPKELRAALKEEAADIQRFEASS